MGWMRKFSPFVVLAIVLMTFTAAIAAYTGPIRPRTVEDGGVRTIYQNSPWTQICRCAYGSNGLCGDADAWCRCDVPPYNSSAYTCYESPRTVTHNPATASGSFTCSTWGSSGWCRGGASLNVSGSEPVSGYSISRMEGNYDNSNNAAVSCNGSSCSFTPPQGQGTFWYWAVSTYGDTSAKGSMTYKHDSGAPSVSLSPSGTMGGGGWYRSNVTVSGSGSDAVSGLAGVSLSCGSNPCTITADGTHTITATATDNAGNTASTSVTIRKDTTPPTIAFSPSGTAGNSGWWRSSVTLSASGSDAHSGLSSLSLSCGSNPCTLSAQGANSVTASAGDVAGNTASTSTTIYIDSVPPNASLSPSGTLGANGWYVSNVTVTTGGSDATSGVASVSTRLNGGAWGGSSVTITTDGTHTVEGLAYDVAGNVSSTVSTTIRRDTVPPTASLNIPAPNGSNGWFVTNPTVSTGGSDATSGIAASQVRVNGGAWQSSAAVSGDGTHTVEGRAQDNAGHWSSTVSATVRVDTTPPAASASIPAPNGQNGWYVSPVTVTAQGDDATSGIASREVRLGSGAWQANSLTVSTDGTHTVTVRTTDNAGLTNTATVNVPYDATPPTISGLDVSGTAGNNGWYRSNVAVAGIAADATSGIALVQVNGQPNLSLSDGVHSVTVRAVDQAGNESTQTITVRVDTTPPDLTPQLSPVDGLNGWYIQGASIDAVADDTLSGLADVRVRVDGGNWQSLPLTLTDEGVYEVEIQAEDEAGHITSRSLTISIDRTAPTITPDLPAPDGKNGWFVSPFDVDYTTTDNLSGVEETQWRLNGGDWQNGTPQLDGEGEIILDIRSQDTAGNERIRRYTFSLDQSLPTGEIALTGEAGVEEWYRSPVEAVLTGTDAVSGVAETRILGVNTQQNGEVSLQSASETISAKGWHTLTGEVEDNAGWVREISRSFGIDLTLPQGGFDQLPELLSGTVELTGEAKDLLSGLQKAEISFSMGYQWQELTAALDRWSFQWDTTQTGGGYRRIYLRLTDKAGNTYTASVNVLVSNALPQAAVTEVWTIDQSGIVSITPGDLPIRQVCLTIQDPADETRKIEWCGESVESIPNPVRWDGKFADGTIAGPGQYRVTVIVTDTANRTVSASGTVIVPAPTATPTIPPVIPESGGNTPTRLPLLPTATPTPTPTPTETPVEVEEEQPTATPPAVSMVLPTPQPTIPFKPPKYEFQAQAAVEVVRRALWPFLTLLGLAAALGYSAVRDERPKAIRKLAERMETIIQFKQEVK